MRSSQTRDPAARQPLWGTGQRELWKVHPPGVTVWCTSRFLATSLEAVPVLFLKWPPLPASSCPKVPLSCPALDVADWSPSVLLFSMWNCVPPKRLP